MFNEKKKYKIGYFTDFKGDFRCSPSHRRAVLESLKIVEDLGHYTEEIDIKGAHNLTFILMKAWHGNSKA